MEGFQSLGLTLLSTLLLFSAQNNDLLVFAVTSGGTNTAMGVTLLVSQSNHFEAASCALATRYYHLPRARHTADSPIENLHQSLACIAAYKTKISLFARFSMKSEKPMEEAISQSVRNQEC